MMTPNAQGSAVHRFGLTEVYKPTHADVDVVFVHGLNGDPFKTWTSESSRVFWPAQLLPPILEEEKTRILVYGYDADVTSFTDGVSRDKIHNHAEHLVAELAANRRVRKATERPIVFVGHSLGGLVIKRALIYSSEIRGLKTEHLRSIFVSTYGILFLGTPHKGSNLAEWGSRLERICGAVMPKKIMDSEPQLIDALKSNNETLQNIDRQFMQIMSRYHIYFFHEGKPTDLKGSLRYVVDEESASPTVQDVERAGIQADHSHMCKFEDDNAPGFDLVAEGIQRYAEAAPVTVKSRWDTEKEERLMQNRAAAAELAPGFDTVDSTKGTPHSDTTSTFTSSAGKSQKALPALPAPESWQEHATPSYGEYEVEEVDRNSTSNLALKNSSAPSRSNLKDEATNTIEPPKPPEPYFIVPPGFRANTFFVGMEKELQELDRGLFDKRRHIGTACVLLYGQPGGGKSHLARQYVFKNRRKFPCGIFWIQAKLREERDQAFWNIHQKAVARETPEACIINNGNERCWVAEVRAWFEARHDWLIVFDGLVIDRDEDATELQEFIPDSTKSSIIYISRARNLESKQRLFRPYPIKVPPLKEEDARKLLFKTLNMKKPTDVDMRSAKAIVKQIGGLPLAIDAVSHRLADTREPLSKFSFKSYSADPKMGGTYNKILDDLQRLEHMEAWNLINILCFYAQHIPVEMIHLGLRALRSYPVEIMSSDDGGKPDFNNTISVLIRYALIERNEPDDKDSVSSSRDSFSGPEPIDMIKIHSVVQKFCCDSLNAKQMLPEWLGKAVKVFIHSYRQADVKIKQKPEPGRVSDYRYYLVHGQRIWDHSKSYESKNQPLVDIRRELDPVLAMINEQIRNQEPTSSQENIMKDTYQVSIFDRTNSTSESGPSMDEAQTPEHEPTSPQVGENNFGIDIRKPSVDSPISFGTTSPNFEPRIVANSPGLQLPNYYDIGYESDREPLTNPRNMQKSNPETTTQPRRSAGESHGNGSQTVPLNRKIKKPKQPRRDLGTFRPTPAGPKMAIESAQGLVAHFNQDSIERPRSSHDAFASLAEVQHRSPPRVQNTRGSFWQRRTSGLPPASQPTRPTYAGIAAGQHRGSLPKSVDLEHDGSSDNFQSRQRNRQPSPLTTRSVPRQTLDHTFESPGPFPPLDVRNHTRQQFHGPQYTLSGSAPNLDDSSRARFTDENFDPSYSYPPTIGPNHNSFPTEDILASKPQFEFSSQAPRYIPSSPPSHGNHSSHSNPPPSVHSTFHTNSPPFPSGYYSQPMSRHESRHSHPSLPETEPSHYPSSFSPRRDHDGRALRKSPKTASNDYPMPFYPNSTSPHSAAHDLSGTGTWAYPAYPPPPAELDLSMSRSSSGPGLALGEGLGIVHFDEPGLVQFGEHTPVNIEAAKRRAQEYQLRLGREEVRRSEDGRAWSEERGRGRGRRGEGGRMGTPYPDFNLIPTMTDPVEVRGERMDIG